jgi:peptide/nickel transport system substrate-binding protein
VDRAGAVFEEQRPLLHQVWGRRATGGAMELREAFEYEFSAVDPLGTHIDPTVAAVYETLLLKSSSGAPVPYLASGWEVADDGLEWHIHIRPHCTFHSGRRCSAEAVVEALSSIRRRLAGTEDHWYWNAVRDLRAHDEQTLVFTLRYPYERLFSLLWGYHTAVHNERARKSTPGRFGTALADGTGPFVLSKWSRKEVAATRWDAYSAGVSPSIKSRGPASLSGIRWYAIPDSADRLKALLSGDVHCAHAPPYTELQRLLHSDKFIMTKHNQRSNIYLALNWTKTEFDFEKVNVRRAVSFAIDRKAIVEEVFSGYAFPTAGGLPPATEYYDERVDAKDVYDQRLAERLLDQEGWRCKPNNVRAKEGRLLRFQCVCQDDEYLRGVGECIRRQLAKLGIVLQLRFVKPFAGFYEACANDADSFISKWLWQDPVDAIIGFTSSLGIPGPNWQRAVVPQLEESVRDWYTAHTPEEHRRAASAIQTTIREQLPLIPIVTPVDVWINSRSVRGWNPNSANLYPIYQDTWIQEG